MTHRVLVDEHRRYYQRRVQDTIAAGVRSEEFVVPDVRLVTLALLDMLDGTSSWYHADGMSSPEQLADAYVELAVGGLLHAHLGT